jgi:geranylgeranyl pyrophosphate synthase
LLTDEFSRRASDEQRIRFDAAFGNHLAATEQLADFRTALRESGAVEVIESHIEDAYQEAIKFIDTLTVSDAFKQTLNDLVTLSLKREK